MLYLDIQLVSSKLLGTKNNNIGCVHVKIEVWKSEHITAISWPCYSDTCF